MNKTVLETNKGHAGVDRWSCRDGCISLVRDAPSPQPISFVAEPEPLIVDMSRSALIVIDMQNDFLDPAGWFASVRGADVAQLSSVVPSINALSAAFRCRKAPVIHLNWGVRSDLANLPANVIDKASSCGRIAAYGDQIQSGEVLVKGSWGSNSVPAIEKHPNDIEISKHRLSGFCDNELEQTLRRQNITSIFYTGVNLDRCVFATMVDGCFHGFDAIVVEDATTTVSSETVSESILYLVRLLYGFTATSAAILAASALEAEQTDTDQNLQTKESKYEAHTSSL